MDRWECLEDLIEENTESNEVPKIPVDPKEDAVFIVQSSGTTGLPKGVVITHYTMIACLVIVRCSDNLYFPEVQEEALVGMGPTSHVLSKREW